MKIKSSTKTELASQYNVSLVTYFKWIKDIESLKLDPSKRILTPKQVEIVVNHLGEP